MKLKANEITINLSAFEQLSKAVNLKIEELILENSLNLGSEVDRALELAPDPPPLTEKDLDEMYLRYEDSLWT